MMRIAITILALGCAAPLAAPGKTHGSGAVQACQWAAEKNIHRNHPHAVRVEFLDGKARKVSKNERDVKGSGRFQVEKGKNYRFAYRCTYNTRTKKTYDVHVKKK